ncbi:flagellar biosynthesis anti-sigma factor FlgM [Novipirellula galeiformis]|nr:flagellar biosynthesis anti-sigma factor FlgM [Novipirellula galeiformis]
MSASQNAGGAQRTQTPSPNLTTPKKSASPVDQLDLSSAASGVNRLEGAIAGGGEIRVDRVADLRRQIASGNYDTPEKLDAALDRMLDQLA